MKTLISILSITFKIVGFFINIIFVLLAFAFSVLAAAQFAEDKENGYR